MKLLLNFLIITFLLIPIRIFAQDDADSCQKNFNRIIETYNKYKQVYLTALKDSLKAAILNDSIIKKEIGQSLKNDFNDLNIFIVPFLYFNGDEDDYTNKINICDYLELDTINYEYDAYIYYNNQLFIYCCFKGGCGADVPGRKFGFYPPGFYFQYFINDEFRKNNKIFYEFQSEKFDAKKDFPFTIRGLGVQCYANKENWKIYLYYVHYSNDLQKFIIERSEVNEFFESFNTSPEWQIKII